MAEKIVSPGVFTRENDLSFVQQGVAEIGAALVGPTARGPVLVPTEVSTYSEFVEIFGESYESGSSTYQFFTSIAAREYLKNSGALTVTRVGTDNFTKASSSFGTSKEDGVPASGSGTGTAVAEVAPDGKIVLTEAHQNDGAEISIFESGNEFKFILVDAPVPNDNESERLFYVLSGSGNDYATDVLTPLVAKIDGVASLGDAKVDGTSGIEYTASSGVGALGNSTNDFRIVSGATSVQLTGGVTAQTDFTSSFKIFTHGEGEGLNSTGAGTEGTNNVLPSGSRHNFRWEITGVNPTKGTFNLLIRRGDDTIKRKTILEQFNGLTMDPNDSNFIGKRVGTQRQSVQGNATDGFYLQPTGTYPNNSKFIFIEESSIQEIPNYLDSNGTINDAAADLTASRLPQDSSGSFNGGADDYQHPMKFYSDITSTNVQGLNPLSNAQGKESYEKAFSLLANPDEFDINLLSSPGLYHADHSSLINTYMIDKCEDRGDVMCVIDPVKYNRNIADATTQAESVDSSYAAMYWPWVQVPNTVLGNFVFVPQSTLIPGVYAFNDKVSHEWFAPAGLNRGGLETVVQAERKLTLANRDTLYESNVNPAATFPGEGVVVFGQKTLQKKASALDRVNVRRLLIDLKKFVASTAKFLVFENNTTATRNRFLAQVEPYMQSVQENQGLFAFRVVMDDTNNTPDVIDRNQMVGSIFIQPAKAAEFIVIDFNILPTGATFDD